MSCRPRPLAILLAALLIPGLSVTAGGDRRGRPDAPKEKEKPRLRLVADTSVGFPPVTVTATAWLTGVDPADANFCHAAATWTKVEPGQSEDAASKVREDPACLHPPEQISVQMMYAKTFVLYTPGSYLFRLMIEGKDRTRIQSGYVKVEVLRPQ